MYMWIENTAIRMIRKNQKRRMKNYDESKEICETVFYAAGFLHEMGRKRVCRSCTDLVLC